MTTAATLIHTDPATIPGRVSDLLAEGSLYAGLTFWQAVTRSGAAIAAGATTAEEVIAILRANPHTAETIGHQGLGEDAGFWHTGGDDRIGTHLRAAGWVPVWAESALFYVVRHPESGDYLTYCEGDVGTGFRWGAPVLDKPAA